MERKVLNTISAFNMIQAGDKILLGLSGGMDSAVLLHFLMGIRHEFDIEIFAAHVNHGLRGEESICDEIFCRRICDEYRLALEVIRYDVGGLAADWGMSVESAGRRVRYEAFEGAGAKFGCNKIATAHNRNDSVETMLLALLRGSGMAGLAGIAPVRNNIIRPLIDVDRDEIAQYCARHDVEYVEDSSNASAKYQRNRIRQTLLPTLIADYNPALLDTMSRTAKILRDEHELIEQMANDTYACIVQNDEIAAAKLAKAPAPVARRVTRNFLEEHGIVNIAYEHIEGVIKLAGGGVGREIHLPGGMVARRCYDSVKITKKLTEPLEFCYKLEVGRPIYVRETKKWFYLGHKEYIGDSSGENSIRILYTKALNYVKIENGLEVRTRRPGDLLYFSKVGTKKVKDFFIDRKYPAEVRRAAVFIACGKNVIVMLGADGFESDFYETNGGDKAIFLQIWEDIT